MQETQVQSLGQEDPLQKETATHSSIPAWEIPWQRSLAGYNLVTKQPLGTGTWGWGSLLHGVSVGKELPRPWWDHLPLQGSCFSTSLFHAAYSSMWESPVWSFIPWGTRVCLTSPCTQYKCSPGSLPRTAKLYACSPMSFCKIFKEM